MLIEEIVDAPYVAKSEQDYHDFLGYREAVQRAIEAGYFYRSQFDDRNKEMRFAFGPIAITKPLKLVVVPC